MGCRCLLFRLFITASLVLYYALSFSSFIRHMCLPQPSSLGEKTKSLCLGCAHDFHAVLFSSRSFAPFLLFPICLTLFVLISLSLSTPISSSLLISLFFISLPCSLFLSSSISLFLLPVNHTHRLIYHRMMGETMK